MTAVDPGEAVGEVDATESAGPFDRLGLTEESIVDTLARLRRKGFVGEFVLEPEDIPPGLCCRTCGRRHLPRRTTVAAVHRFEGPTSPEDEALLLALVCPRCGAKGTVVTSYGPVAAPEEAELLQALATSATATFPELLPGRPSN